MKLDLTNRPVVREAAVVDLGEMTVTFNGLTNAKYCLLTTYRRDGTAVPTPVWFVRDGDDVLVCTDDPSGKVSRIRRDARVAVAPCSLRGRRLGPDAAGRAVVLSGHDVDGAQVAMHRDYSVGKRLFYRFVHPLVSRRKKLTYLRIVPDDIATS